MSKSKMIAFVVWLVTLILPFKAGFLDEMKPNMYTLIMFVLTLTGVSIGAFFFSKKEDSSKFG